MTRLCYPLITLKKYNTNTKKENEYNLLSDMRCLCFMFALGSEWRLHFVACLCEALWGFKEKRWYCRVLMNCFDMWIVDGFKWKAVKMSQTNDAASCSNMESGKRARKLTEKALVNKIEKLQNDRKHAVDKIKGLIPRMKELMKQKENVSEVKECLRNLNTLWKCHNCRQSTVASTSWGWSH